MNRINAMLRPIISRKGKKLFFSLNDRRHTLTTADTGIGTTIPPALFLKNSRQRAGQADTGGSQGMTDGRAAAHDIDTVRIEPQLFDAIERHDTKSFVDFPVIDIRRLKAGLVQGLLTGRHRSVSHDGGIDPGKPNRSNGSQRFDAFLFGGLLGHQHHGCGRGV